MVFEGLVGLGVACLLAPAIAEYAKIRHKAERGFNWFAMAGVWFIFAAAFPLVPTIASFLTFGTFSLADIFAWVGWLVALIGTLFVGYEMLVEK